MPNWQVAIIVALIGQLPVFITMLRVLAHVRRSTDGQHDELVRDLNDLRRRLEVIEQETGVISRAVVADQMRGKRFRWLRP